jgi:hypothetical protein
VAILRRHLIDRIPIAELCDEYKIHPTMFYQWQAQFFQPFPEQIPCCKFFSNK